MMPVPAGLFPHRADGVAGKADAKFIEGLAVHLAQHHG